MTHTLHIVSHTHWDREWYQPFQEYRIRLVQLVDRLLDLLDQDPEYRHFTLDGQTILLEDYLEIRPAREMKLREYIQQGRLLVGPWYILPDEFLVSPEATIRNLMLGDRVACSFGSRMNLGYVPDSFGHISQLPQILRGSGLDVAALWRGVGNLPNEFRWAGPDGSEVLVIHLREGYGNAAHLPKDAEGFVTRLEEIVESISPHAATSHLLAMNGTDHLEPMPGLTELIAYARDRLADLVILHSTLPQFAAAVRAANPSLELHSGELRSTGNAWLLPGVFSTRMWIKQRNSRCETLLEKWVEPFLAMTTAYGLETRTRNPSALCWQAWRYLIQNHPHDSICGCSVDAVHKEMDVRFDWVEQIGEELTLQCLDALANGVDTAQLSGIPVVVFNPTAGPRVDMVTARLHLPPDVRAIEVVDVNGRRMPSEIAHPGAQMIQVLHLNEQELRWNWAETEEGTLAGRGIQAIETSTAGDTARIEIVTAPCPAAADVLERARSEVMALLDRPEIRRFEVRIHVMHLAEVRFMARDLPGHGYKTFAIRPVSHASGVSRPEETGRIQNEFFELVAEPSSGTVTATNKRTGMVLPGLNWFVDSGDRGDEYNYCPPENDHLVSAPAKPPSLRVVEDNAVCQTLEIAQVYQVPASLTDARTRRSDALIELPLTTRISLSPGVPRIDFSTTVENRAADHRLRVHFPTPIETDVAHAEGHFDVIARSWDLPQNTEDWPEQPVPTGHQRTFVDVSDGRGGLLVANQGLPEYEVIPGEQGVTVALTLLRCVGWLSRHDLPCRRGGAGPSLATPGAQCIGPHTFHYALVPHSGRWEEAYAQAHAFNAPLRVVATASSGGSLPVELGLLRSSPSGFVLTAIKWAEEGDGLIVRGFNITDEACTVTIESSLALEKVTQVALNENTLRELAKDGNRVRFVARPKQIVTLKLAVLAEDSGPLEEQQVRTERAVLG